MRQSKADTLKNAAFRKLYHGGKPKSRQFGPLKAEKGKIGNCNKICRSGEGQLLQCAYHPGCQNCNLCGTPFVGRGLDPADPVPVIEWRVELNQVR